MEWSPADPHRLLSLLRSIEEIGIKTGRFLLGLLIAGILAGVVLVVLHPPWAGHQGEWFYFSVGVLLALGWAIRSYIALGRRRERNLPVAFRTKTENDVHTWELQIGTPPEQTSDNPGARPAGVQLNLSPSIRIPLASFAREALPDEATLRRIEAEVACGADLDDVCRAVQPAYADWNAPARWAYRRYVTTLLRQGRSGSDAE